MEKKQYQTANTEIIYIMNDGQLLGESVDKGIDNGYGEPEAKELDLFSDEPIKEWGSVWED